jgi:hypothetical protein
MDPARVVDPEAGPMSMIFPGMDPYLEHPQRWIGVHSRLVVYIADQ